MDDIIHEPKQFCVVVTGGTSFEARRYADKRAREQGLGDWVVVKQTSRRTILGDNDSPMIRTYWYAPQSLPLVMYPQMGNTRVQ